MAGGFPLGELPAELVSAEVLPHCDEYAPATRAVCRAWRARKATPRATRWRGLSFLAERGHQGLIDWTKEIRGAFMQPQVNEIFVAACRGGHAALVHVLHREWVEGKYIEKGFQEACGHGRAGVVAMLRERERSLVEPFLKLALERAACAGHYGLAVALWQWDKELSPPHWHTAIVENMLASAARGGHLDLVRLAEAHGATLDKDSFEIAFFEAVTGGHMVAIDYFLEHPNLERARDELLTRWPTHAHHLTAGMRPAAIEHMLTAGTVVDEMIKEIVAESNDTVFIESFVQRHGMLHKRAIRLMMDAAVERGNQSLCQLARQYGASVRVSDYDGAATYGHINILRQLRQWELEDEGLEPSPNSDTDMALDHALTHAILNGNTSCAEALWGWGARIDEDDFEGLDVLGSVASEGYTALMHKLRQWMEEQGLLREYNEAMKDAARAGEEDAMRLIQLWAEESDALGNTSAGDLDYHMALNAAATNGHVGAMRLLKQWAEARGKPFMLDDLSVALDAAEHDRARILLREWGAVYLDENIAEREQKRKEDAEAVARNGRLTREAFDELLGSLC